MPIATNNDQIDISSEKKIEEFTKKIQNKITKGHIIFLYGEMGVGKTTFVRYLINHYQRLNNLNLTEVNSPTFNLLNEYKINKVQINHYDLFRLKSIKEINSLNIFENNNDLITLIEWPQLIEKKPENLIEFFFSYDEEYKKRYLQIKGLLL